MGVVPRRSRVLAFALFAALAGPASARGDSLATQPRPGNAGYTPVEELSYEVIVAPGRGYDADVRLRVTLHNSSAEAQDAVASLGLPADAELIGLGIARGGEWSEGIVTEVSSVPDPREPGLVFARRVPPATSGDIPIGEIIAFGIESGATLQVELRLSVRPVLRGGRWHLDLPHRGAMGPALATDRRVIVTGLARGEGFWIDDVSNDGSPVMITRPRDAVTVSWPAHARTGALLGGRYEYSDDPFGKDGTFRLLLRLGHSPASRPDHLVLLVDRSRSTGARQQIQTAALLERLFDALPAGTTFEAIAFARDARPLLAEDTSSVRDPDIRRRLALALERADLAEGTDLAAGLELAADRLAHRDAEAPMILVVTDGMLPVSVDPVALAERFRNRLGRRSVAISFLVADPLLARRGLPADHPVASTAAALGARIGLADLAHAATDPLEVLSAPKVLGELSIGLPRRAVLHDDVPAGLVAGNFVVLEGRYEGRAPASVSVRGRLGRQVISTKLRAQPTPERPDALVATTANPDRLASAAAEGLALPPWYTRRMLREARQQITQAGRTGQEIAGQLDASIFRRYLRQRVLPRSRSCFNRALARNQTQGGRVTFDIEVGKGEVLLARLADITLTDPGDVAFVECLTEAAWALDIPAGHLDDHIYRVRYPVAFEAPLGGVPPRTNEGPDPIFEMLMERADVLAR